MVFSFDMVFYGIFLILLYGFMPYTCAATILAGFISPTKPWPVGIVFLYEMWLKHQNDDEAPRGMEDDENDENDEE